MKGKIILAFTLALLALAVVGFVGQRTLSQLIISIKKESQPNPKLIAIQEIINDLSEAERSVRTYTITHESENLSPFYEAISTIDAKIDKLYALNISEEELFRIDSMEVLIEEKFKTLKQLIDIREDQSANKMLENVLKNITDLRQKDSIPRIDTTPNFNPSSTPNQLKKVEIIKRPKKRRSILKRIFGSSENEEQELIVTYKAGESPPSSPNINNDTLPTYDYLGRDGSTKEFNVNQIGDVISKIGEQEKRQALAIQRRELALTIRDNTLMQKILYHADRIEENDKEKTRYRAVSAEQATNKAINIISVILVVSLFAFAILLFIIFSDIARNKRNKAHLREAKEHAENLAKVKQTFLSNMSHEIRTPLSSIIGFTEQLQDTRLDENQLKYLNNIHHSGKHLLSLINDILDYAKLESGKLSLESIAFDIRESIEQVIASFENIYREKGLTIHTIISSEHPRVVVGDPVRFNQILINLLSNAIKFTAKGTIEVKLFPCNVSRDEVQLQLTVTDSGIGIPENKRNDIFQDFSQADSSTGRKYGGTGLGLSIVKKIVDSHKGSISIESEEGKGTSFIVDLNYKIGEEKDLIAAKKQTGKYDVNALIGKRILVVDDQEYNLELIALILDKWKVKSTILNNGSEAIEVCITESFDLILMDIQMPGMNGLETTEKIREIQSHKTTPILALTAAASAEELQQCTQAGMDGYLLKPFSQKELYNTLVSFLTPSPNRHSSDIDIEGLRAISNGDTRFIINMLNVYTRNFEADLKALKEAYSERKWDKIKAKAHKMTAPSKHLSFDEVSNFLKRLAEESGNGLEFEEANMLINKIDKCYHQQIKITIEKEIVQLESELLASKS